MKKNIEKQEQLVSLLYNFHEQQTDLPHNCTYERALPSDSEKRTINLPAVREAMEKIMKLFGYEIIPIQ